MHLWTWDAREPLLQSPCLRPRRCACFRLGTVGAAHVPAAPQQGHQVGCEAVPHNPCAPHALVPVSPVVLCGNHPGAAQQQMAGSGTCPSRHTSCARGPPSPHSCQCPASSGSVLQPTGTHPPLVAEEMTGYGASQSYDSGRDDPILQNVSVAAECPAGQPCSELGWRALRTPCVRRVPLLHDPGSHPAALPH